MHSFKRSLLPSIIHWIPLAVLTVLLCGTLFAAIQSDLRSGADDPQIQMATDARDSLQVGASAQSLVPTTQIDIAQSLAPYLVIYDGPADVDARGRGAQRHHRRPLQRRLCAGREILAAGGAARG